jgi:hypothetical protein
MSGARQFSLKWQNPAARVPLREIVFADASPQTPGEHHHRSASPENGLIQDVLNSRCARGFGPARPVLQQAFSTQKILEVIHR